MDKRKRPMNEANSSSGPAKTTRSSPSSTTLSDGQGTNAASNGTRASSLVPKWPSVDCQNAELRSEMEERMKAIKEETLRIVLLLEDTQIDANTKDAILRRFFQTRMPQYDSAAPLASLIDKWLEYFETERQSSHHRLVAATKMNSQQLAAVVFCGDVGNYVRLVGADNRHALFRNSIGFAEHIPVIDTITGTQRKCKWRDSLHLPPHYDGHVRMAFLSEDRLLIQANASSNTCLILAQFNWETLTFQVLNRLDVRGVALLTPIVNRHAGNEFVIVRTSNNPGMGFDCAYCRIDEDNGINWSFDGLIIGDAGLSYPRLYDGRLYGILEGTGASMYRFVAYDFQTGFLVEAEDFRFWDAQTKTPFDFALPTHTHYAWDDSPSLTSPTLYIVVCDYRDLCNYQVFSFNTRTLEWRRTAIRGPGYVCGMHVESDGFLTLAVDISPESEKERSTTLVCRYPLRKPDTLQNMCCHSIRQQKMLFDRDLLADAQFPPNLRSFLFGK